MQQVTQPKKQIFSIIVKCLNYASVLLLIVCCIFRFISYGPTVASEGYLDNNSNIVLIDQPSDPFYYVMTFCLLPLSGLMLISEIQYKPVLKYVEFIGGPCGRGTFYIFVSLLIFDPNYRIDMTTSIAITLIGMVNMVLSCLNATKSPQE